MKSIAIIGLVIAGVAIPTARAGDGKALYTAKCAACHAPAGEGKPAIAKMMGVTLPVLGSAAVQGRSDADLKKVIVEGKGKMKPAAGLAGKDAEDIIAFVRTLKQ